MVGMESPLEAVEFLARAPNRVAVLRALAEGPHTRNELAAETGASQATLGRILADFRERVWARRVDGTHEATATGRLVADALADLLETVETEQALRAVVEYLPTDALDFDLRRLADARITYPSPTRPNAPVKRDVELVRAGERITVFSHTFNEQTLAATTERVASGESTFRGVFSTGAIDALAEDPTLSERLETIAAAERASVRVRETVPVAAMIVDGVVHVMLRDEHGVLRASIDTDDPGVCEWAERAFERYWEDAAPLDPDALS